jgi:hypothetical protein
VTRLNGHSDNGNAGLLQEPDEKDNGLSLVECIYPCEIRVPPFSPRFSQIQVPK